MRYNGDGVLVQAGTTVYTQDLAAPLSQVLSDGTSTYLYGLDRLAALHSSGERDWYLSDALGSVRMTLDDGGTSDYASGYAYSPFGVVESGAVPEPFGFTGELQNAELVYLRARWYDAASSTFTSRDSFAGWSERPDSLHPYIYVGNDPVLYTDPSGETWYLTNEQALDVIGDINWYANQLDLHGLIAGASGAVMGAESAYALSLRAEGLGPLAAFFQVGVLGIAGGCAISAANIMFLKNQLTAFSILIENNNGENGIAIATDDKGIYFLNRDPRANLGADYWTPTSIGRWVLFNNLPSNMRLGAEPQPSGMIGWWETPFFTEDMIHIPPDILSGS